jgi:phytoene dehydrogenase-like protein
MHYDVIIVGAGLSGLSCALTLHKRQLSFVVVEAGARPGGRIQTDLEDGFQLDHGFQVLQTGYPEAQRILDFQGLDLQRFPAGVAVRYNKQFHIIADPRHHPRYLLSTLAAPIGTLGDRLAMLRLTRLACRGSLPEIFAQPEQRTSDFLRHHGFSQGFIERFFVPFFAGACLDRNISASSRVFQYIFRMFSQGDAALPAKGMGDIPRQLADKLPKDAIHTNCTVVNVADGVVTLSDGRKIHGRRVVLATSQPAYEKLLGVPVSRSSLGENCLYFSSSWRPPFKDPFLLLNGDGQGPVNNIAFPSLVAPHYSASGKTLIAVVVLGQMHGDGEVLEQAVRQQCFDWFGNAVHDWEHLRTYHIEHALPEQTVPTANPYVLPQPVSEQVRACGEYKSLPGIQWALLSGRQTADALIAELC